MAIRGFEVRGELPVRSIDADSRCRYERGPVARRLVVRMLEEGVREVRLARDRRLEFDVGARQQGQ